jgi:cytochrome P450
MRLELPQTSEWTEVGIHSKLLRIVTMASGRIFIGPELCRTEAYIDAAINYTIDLMTAVHIVTLLPSWLRPIISSYLGPVRKLERRVKEAHGFLHPIIQERREAAKVAGYEKPDDMLQWIMDALANAGKSDDDELARYQLAVSFAAIHTTTITATNS